LMFHLRPADITSDWGGKYVCALDVDCEGGGL
jgi:hypothetical protein